MNKFGYTKVEILVIVILLGIVAFVTINKTSYAFAIDNTKAVEDVKSLIEIQARTYALDNLSIFNESTTTYINVNDLVINGYLIPNEDGLIINPADINKNFNNNKIKLDYISSSNNIEATLVE